MPKKHTPSYTQTKPTYVHPSLESARTSASSGSSQPQTVTERINRLRREQAPRPTPQQRDEITSVVSRTVPPELRRIMNIPEVNAPKPKAGMRSRRADNRTRPPPGPAAPSSWLLRSRFARQSKRRNSKTETQARRFGTLARVPDGNIERLPPPDSLTHYCFKTLAQNWRELSEYEQHYIPALRATLKEAVLSYLTIFGNTACLDFNSFKILFQNEDGGQSGWNDIKFLDLNGLFNDRFTGNDLVKCFRRPNSQLAWELEKFSIDARKDAREAKKASAEIADSWEDDEDEDGTPPLVLTIQTPHFDNLTRLSLAHPGTSATWSDLLRLSAYLGKLTHLSLAYWPRPSSTPNAATTSMQSRHSTFSLGGTHYYSDLDNDYYEAANILRRLSINTYSLQWLDLEGCPWYRALTWSQGGSFSSFSQVGPTDLGNDAETWTDLNRSTGPDWNDSWKRVTYLNLFQGWLPANVHSLQNMPSGLIPARLMRWLREHQDQEDVKWKLNKEETGAAIANWIHQEKEAMSVAQEIHRRRKEQQGEWIHVDHGWVSA